MIIIGLGANLKAPGYDSPLATLKACVQKLNQENFTVLNVSRWYESAPVPVSDQPWYINGAIHVETSLSPRDCLSYLLKIEAEFGRVRDTLNAPRVLDLDLLAHGDHVIEDQGDPIEKPFCLPHPRLHERAFTLMPISDLNPEWVHPKLAKNITALLKDLPEGQIIRPVSEV